MGSGNINGKLILLRSLYVHVHMCWYFKPLCSSEWHITKSHMPPLHKSVPLFKAPENLKTIEGNSGLVLISFYYHYICNNKTVVPKLIAEIWKNCCKEFWQVKKQEPCNDKTSETDQQSHLNHFLWWTPWTRALKCQQCFVACKSCVLLTNLKQGETL